MVSIEQLLAPHNFSAFANAAELEAALSDKIIQQLNIALSKTGRASIAVSGGSTPKALFKLLSMADIDWQNIDVSLVDERWVATDSDQSNEKMLHQQLLVNHASKANFIGMKSAVDDIEAGVIEYNTKLKNHIKQPFDILLLGMGNDGHTASWFPDAAEIEQALNPGGQSATLATRPLSQPMPRISLSFSCVAQAENIILHITGAEKRKVLENGLVDQQDTLLPIHQTLLQLQQAVDIYWTA